MAEIQRTSDGNDDNKVRKVCGLLIFYFDAALELKERFPAFEFSAGRVTPANAELSSD